MYLIPSLTVDMCGMYVAVSAVLSDLTSTPPTTPPLWPKDPILALSPLTRLHNRGCARACVDHFGTHLEMLAGGSDRVDG